jgi:5-methylcytosine-specific restriction endonuclease McrA
MGKRKRKRKKVKALENGCFDRFNDARRRAKLLGLPSDFTRDDWQTAVRYWQSRCVVCGRSRRLTLDHWIPLTANYDSNPGTTAGNIVPLCHDCNTDKSNQLPGEWLVARLGSEQAGEILYRVEIFFAWALMWREKEEKEREMQC